MMTVINARWINNVTVVAAVVNVQKRNDLIIASDHHSVNDIQKSIYQKLSIIDSLLSNRVNKWKKRMIVKNNDCESHQSLQIFFRKEILPTRYLICFCVII